MNETLVSEEIGREPRLSVKRALCARLSDGAPERRIIRSSGKAQRHSRMHICMRFAIAALHTIPFIASGCAPSQNGSYRLVREIGAVRVNIGGEYFYFPHDDGRGAHQAQVSCIEVAPDNQTFVSGDGTGVIKLWKLPNGSLVQEAKTPNGEWVRAMKFCHDGRWLCAVTGSDGQSSHVIVLSARTLKRIYSFALERGTDALAVSPDGSTIVIGARVVGGASRMEIAGNTVRVVEMPDAWKIAMTEERERVFVINDNGLDCWDWKEGKLIYSVKLTSVPQDVARYSHGCAVGMGVLRGRGSVGIVGCGSGERVGYLRGDVAEVYSIVASSDAHRVATLDYDGALSVWNVETGELCQKFPMPDSPQKAPDKVAISCDGRYIIRGTRGHDVSARTGDIRVYRWEDRGSAESCMDENAWPGKISGEKRQ